MLGRARPEKPDNLFCSVKISHWRCFPLLAESISFKKFLIRQRLNLSAAWNKDVDIKYNHSQSFNQKNLISLQNDFKLEIGFEFQAPRAMFCTQLLPTVPSPYNLVYNFSYWVVLHPACSETGN